METLPLRNIVTVVRGVSDPLDVALKQHWLIYRNPSTVHQGFCVSLEGLFFEERLLPIRAKAQGKLKLQFKARGRNIRITLTDRPEPTRHAHNREVLHVHI